MRRLLRVLLLVLFARTTFAQQQEIIFTAGDQKWAVNSTAIARVSKTGPFLTVFFDKLTMRVNRDYKFAPVKVVSYKVGIVHSRADGQWEVVRWSEAVTSGSVMPAGQTRLIEAWKAIIPIDGIPSLKDKWLVIAVDTELGNRSIGTNYSHGAPSLN